jgi:hypothetical protein
VFLSSFIVVFAIITGIEEIYTVFSRALRGPQAKKWLYLYKQLID